jgi:hypothetical protein
MPTSVRCIRSFALTAVLALAVTLLSLLIEREGPELASYGNLCGPSSNQACREPVLNAGFPFPYLFDQPGVSVERKLHLLQDNVRTTPFALNFFAYLAILATAILAARRLRNAVPKPHPRSDA